MCSGPGRKGDCGNKTPGISRRGTHPPTAPGGQAELEPSTHVGVSLHPDRETVARSAAASRELVPGQEADRSEEDAPTAPGGPAERRTTHAAPTVVAPVLASLDPEKDWQRAVVTSLGCEPHLCLIFNVGHGTHATVPKTSRPAVNSEFLELAYLEPVVPSGWTAASKDFLKLVDGDRPFICKLMGPHGADKLSEALCDTSRTPEIFIQDLLVEGGHAIPRCVVEGNVAMPSSASWQRVLPVCHGIGAGGEPMNVRSTFGRGRGAAPPASPASVKKGAVPRTTFSMLLMKAAHFRPSDGDLNVHQQASRGASESSGRRA